MLSDSALRVTVLPTVSLVAAALAALLRELGVSAVVAEARRDPSSATPDVVVMPDCGGVHLAGVLPSVRESYPGARVLVVVMEADSGTLARAMQLGVDGLVDGEAGANDLVRAIERVAGGRRVFPATALLSDPALSLSLSNRQREVLRLVASGRSNVEIATALNISINTVKFHVRTIFRELGIHNRVEAARVWAASETQGALLT